MSPSETTETNTDNGPVVIQVALRGLPGVDGTDGENGTNGADGTNGQDGAPGVADDLSVAAIISDPDSQTALQLSNTFGALVAVDPPSGFSLTAPVPYTVYRTGLGLYVLDINVDSMRPAAGVTYYVSAAGTTGNSGLTSASPTTLPSAINKSDVGTIICAAGEYFRNDHTAPTITKSLNIIGQPGAILTGYEKPSNLTWTLTSGNIYQTSRSVTQGVVDKRDAYKTAAGDYPLYTQVADLASVTGPGMWAIVSGIVYVWALGNANLATDASFMRLNLDTTTTVLRVSGANTLYVQGLQVEAGGSLATDVGSINAVNNGTARPRLIVVDTTVKYSPTRGIIANGAEFALYMRCLVATTGEDGISYRTATSGGNPLSPQGIELDCVTRATGIFDASNTGNGSTSHGGAKVLRINGTYRDSLGPCVDEDSGSLSWNLGCVAGSSRSITRPWGYCASASGAQMWLEDCNVDPGKTALYAYDGTSAIHVRRPRTGSLLSMSKVTGPGVIDTY